MTTTALKLRITPPTLLGGRARLVIERNVMVYKHVWIIFFSGFFEPLFYLFAARVGIGRLVGDLRDASGHKVAYAAFVAPALMAASAMNGAVYESTMNIYFKLKFAKTYDGMLATPIEPFDIALGEIGWSLTRGAFYAIGFLIVMAVSGLLHSPLAILSVPTALLTGFAFAAVGMAATTYMRSWQDFDLVTMFVLVLFLFSATFYPLTVYPPALRIVAQISPLYHSVTLIRAFTLGVVGPDLLWHAGFLMVMGAVGLRVAARRLRLILTP
ncbi:MAG: lipooligosaccharide transport system permease protein [Actinomycetota bacterium]|nr:lipooligosaccharide transport system permease protein [Actinomycetota bacterium]